MTPEENLQKLGLELPAPSAPVGAYIPAVRTGNLIFTAGQIPTKQGELLANGKVPSDVPMDIAQAATMQATLNALAAGRGALVRDGEDGSLGLVEIWNEREHFMHRNAPRTV